MWYRTHGGPLTSLFLAATLAVSVFGNDVFLKNIGVLQLDVPLRLEYLGPVVAVSALAVALRPQFNIGPLNEHRARRARMLWACLMLVACFLSADAGALVSDINSWAIARTVMAYSAFVVVCTSFGWGAFAPIPLFFYVASGLLFAGMSGYAGFWLLLGQQTVNTISVIVAALCALLAIAHYGYHAPCLTRDD